MKQLPGQKKQREMKVASWRSYCQQALKILKIYHTNPWRTAPRHMSKIISSLMPHSPSDKKITTGVLQCMSAYHVSTTDSSPQNVSYLSVLQCESMIFCARERAPAKFVPPPATYCKAAVNSSSGELAKSFSIQVEGSLSKRIKLYESLLAPPKWALRSMAAWRASQKL
jgi:hypothetical protein